MTRNLALVVAILVLGVVPAGCGGDDDSGNGGGDGGAPPAAQW